MRVDADAVTFDELGRHQGEQSLDSKIRAALLKYTVGDSREKHSDLCDAIAARMQELKEANTPSMIRGRQILMIIRDFYAVREAKKITYELSNLFDY